MGHTNLSQKLHLHLVAAILALIMLTNCAKNSNGDAKTPGNYIVVLKAKPVKQAAGVSSTATAKSAVTALAGELENRNDLKPAQKVFSVAIKAALYHLDEKQIASVSKDDAVAYIEKDEKISIRNSETPATWGLDRLDQSSLPLDNTYHYPTGGVVVNAYIIDTGILTSHQDFEGRAVTGVDVVNPGGGAVDCNGHGTHVAGTIGSKTYGVAKNAKLFAVRVLDCQGSGNYSDVISGIEWVAANHLSPAVANMSLGGGASQAIDDAVASAVQSGVTFAVAAGNDGSDACQSSPARAPSAITVGATDSSDSRSSFSNTGPCVTLFAPGENITSLWIDSNSATNTISGTSMATPHVTGVAALYLAQNPSATPAQVKAALVAGSINGHVSDVGSSSPNLLLNTAFLSGGNWSGGTPAPGPSPTPTPDPTPAPAPNEPVLSNGAAVKNLGAEMGNQKFYEVIVPSGTKKLTVAISGGTGDVDLYLQAGTEPTIDDYSCRPFIYGNKESCAVTNPIAGKYFVMLNAFDTYGAVTLTVKYK